MPVYEKSIDESIANKKLLLKQGGKEMSAFSKMSMLILERVFNVVVRRGYAVENIGMDLGNGQMRPVELHISLDEKNDKAVPFKDMQNDLMKLRGVTGVSLVGDILKIQTEIMLPNKLK